MPANRTIGNPSVTGASLEEVRASAQFWIRQVVNKLDQLSGLRGDSALYGPLDMQRNRITNLPLPVDGPDAVRYDEALTKSSDPASAGRQWDAEGLQILNLASGAEATDSVNVQQLQAAIAEALAALMNESFVTVAASATLTAERVLTAEATVLVLTDGGPNSIITVSIATNGITDVKLRQGAATSVIGRSVNSLGNVADIVAASDGQLLGRAAGVLAFSSTPIIATSLTDPLLIGGTTTTSTLILRSTSGVGIAGADIIFQTGNNGATEAARILNSGFVGFGISPLYRVDILGTAEATRITRQLANTNVSFGVLRITGECTAEIVDGFGPLVAFSFKDATLAETDVGGLGFVRDGADDSAAFIVRVASVGTLAERFRVSRLGDATVFSVTGGILTLRRVDTSVTANDMVGKLQFYAADTSTTTNFIVADIEAQGTNTVATDINPGRLIFRTTPVGVAAVPTEAMRITETQAVGIGGAPNANASLDVQSTTKPFMPPRMTTTQRDAVASPTAGMVIYNSSTNKLNIYTTTWEAVTSA